MYFAIKILIIIFIDSSDELGDVAGLDVLKVTMYKNRKYLIVEINPYTNPIMIYS